jgi:hypothetical protein
VKIRLRIGQVVLHGVPLAAHDGARFRAALDGELRRLLAAGALPDDWRQGGARPSAVAAAPLALRPGMPAAQLGAGVARSVLGGGPGTPTGAAAGAATGGRAR